MEGGRPARLVAALAAAAALALGAATRAADEAPPAEQKSLGEVSLEEMLNVEVTSVSKKAESAFTAPSAIYVITAEDIRRSGLTTIPELLRLVPGLEVARLNSNNWAISARGFNAQFANKLLVLIDGRDVYNPIFSGTFWDVQDTMIEDIDRIEVIRGPGGTLWGANAVNGIINIITKSAEKTHGALAWAAGGTEERAGGGGRWGGAIGDTLNYRAYVKYWDRSDFLQGPRVVTTPTSIVESGGVSNLDAMDDWVQTRGGTRVEWKPWEKGQLTLLGDYYSGVDHAPVVGIVPQTVQPYRLPLYGSTENAEGGDVVARLNHRFSDDSDLQFQVYYDRFRRHAVDINNGVKLDTLDFNFQHRFPTFWRQSVIWGAGYRRYQDDNKVGLRVDPGPYTFINTFVPHGQTYEIVSGFVQDQLPIIPDVLTFTAGTKIEHNSFTNLEYQPSARLAWAPHPSHFLWAAVSRAVRTPSRVETGLLYDVQTVPLATDPVPVLAIARLRGNGRRIHSESVLAWETGYRMRPWSTASIDAAAFYNDYRHLASVDLDGNPVPLGTTNPVLLRQNLLYHNYNVGTTYGTEVAFTWQVLEPWRLMLNYTFLNFQLRSRSPLTYPVTLGQTDPQNQFHVRSYLNLPHNLEFDTLFWFYDRLPGVHVGSYVRLDARLGWRPTEHVELSLVGQNLAQEEHLEMGTGTGGSLTPEAEIQRGMYGKVTFRF